MNAKVVIKETDLNGRKLKLESGRLAQLSDSSVVASWGETVVLVTVSTKPAQEALDYFPLSVEYVEKYYAGGRITAQKFIKRETKPSDKAILVGRAIDRSIRPLFPKDSQMEVQVIVTVLSFDGENDPGILGLIGTSAALSTSSVPWFGPLGVSNIGTRDGVEVINPPLTEVEHLDMEMTVASTEDKVVMIEAEGKEIPEEAVYEAIQKAHAHSQGVIELINEFTKEAGKAKQSYTPVLDGLDETTLQEMKKAAKEKISAALFDKENSWHEATGQAIKDELGVVFEEKVTPRMVSSIFDKVVQEMMNDTVLNKGQRVDGRAMDEVRQIEIETDILPRTHGSAVFKRGDTQVLSVTTLGPLSASQTLEGMEGESQKRFMHHYNMSINPFATGEVKRIGAPNRRDIGHGDLVERSLLRALPTEEEFPYAIRVVSEVLAANASTSMASLCASTLSLLNAGVPVKPVAGVALGLLSTPTGSGSNEEKFQVITDMRAVEDFYGEMDFKVAGTTNGVTAIQMDTKLQGLSFEIIKEALNQGKKAREFILEKINQVSPSPAQISEFAPKIKVTHVKPEDIGVLIGPGGRNINGIIARTGAQIDIEDDGTVMISSTSGEAIQKALDAVEGMFKTVGVGEEFDGKVVRLAPFGAFVEIAPGKDGLVHVSQMAPGRVESPEDIVEVGQTVHVRVTDVSEGKVGLSMLFGADIKPESEGRPQGRGGGPFQRRGFGGPRRDGRSGGGYQRGGFDRRVDRRGERRGFGQDRGFGRERRGR